MKKITLALCAFLLMGVSYSQAQTTVIEAENVSPKSNNPNPGTPSSVDRELLLSLSNNTTLRVPTGTTVLNYAQGAGFGGVDLTPLLTSIGFTVTFEDGTNDLDVLIPSAAWDLVILQVHSSVLLPAEITAIQTYLTGGGKLIMSYWNLDAEPGLQASLGISSTIDFFAPLPITVWDAANPIFNNPNVVTGLAVIDDNAGDDNGDRMEPAADGTAVAGFVAVDTPNEAAIIIGNGGQSIYHGFAGADVDLTSFLNLIENEAEVFFLGTQDNLIQGFDFYPNPASNMLNLNAVDTIERVAIFNILGQKVFDQSINALSSQVDLSKLAVGTYVMSVTVGAQTGRYKIVKR